MIERVAPLDILYKVGGVRCRSVDPDLLGRLKKSGCVAMYYGMETGSPTMLDVMEKNTNLQQNIDAARWTFETGMYTIYQMVLGMPGENNKTISETSQFIQEVTEYLPEEPHKRLSINYIQALPGTPVYEYGREQDLIGRTLEDEEKYLIDISDVNATDDSNFINFTNQDYLTVQAWRPKIIFDAEANWLRKRNWKPLGASVKAQNQNRARPETELEDDYNRGGYFNLGHLLIHHPLFYRYLSSPLGYPLRVMYPGAYVLVKDFRALPKKRLIGYILSYITTRFKLGRGLKDRRSLRKVMADRTPVPATSSEESMLPLRLGR